MSTSSEEDNMLLVYLLLKKKQRRRQKKRREARLRRMNLGSQEPAAEGNTEENNEPNTEANGGIKTEDYLLLGEHTPECMFDRKLDTLQWVLNNVKQEYEELKESLERDSDNETNIKEENVEDENEPAVDNSTNTEDNVYLNIYTPDDTVPYQPNQVQYLNNIQYQSYPQFFFIKQEPEQ